MDFLVTVEGTVKREVTLVVNANNGEEAAFEGRQDAKKLLAKGPGCITDLQIDNVTVELTATRQTEVRLGNGVEGDTQWQA